MRYALALIALFAIVGTSLAIDSVKILSPDQDQQFELGDQISVSVECVDLDGNSESISRFLVNGKKSSSRFTPAEPGFYKLLVTVIDRYDGTTAQSDIVTIEVLDPAK